MPPLYLIIEAQSTEPWPRLDKQNIQGEYRSLVETTQGNFTGYIYHNYWAKQEDCVYKVETCGNFDDNVGYVYDFFASNIAVYVSNITGVGVKWLK